METRTIQRLHCFYFQDLYKDEVTNPGQDTEKVLEGTDEKGDKPHDDGDRGETVDAEEDENNLESLICEETIPGSPPSHLEVLCQVIFFLPPPNYY